MTDDRETPSAAGVGKSVAASTSVQAPPGHTIRRAVTVDEMAQFRRRPSLSQLAAEKSFEGPRRRSSNLSELSLDQAKRALHDDLLNPKPEGADLGHHEDSSWASVPLAFALLPAFGGLFFKNGSAVVTDIMLLGLAAIFLHWSVTQPWNWYRSAQGVRIREEAIVEAAIDDDSDQESSPPPQPSTRKLEDVPEDAFVDDKAAEGEVKTLPFVPRKQFDEARLQLAQTALSELYLHEVMALVSCFLCPLFTAYLLHAIRSQLSRPSEGLVSSYNLTIFVMASELRPLSHGLKLVQSRTLHLQRIVHSNPFREEAVTAAQVQKLAERLDSLESTATTEAHPDGQDDRSDATKKHEAALVREVRNAIQPDLDALNRAVRRYEKKATVLTFQTESRLNAIDTRLNDAIALAAAAAKNSNAQGGAVTWLVDWVVAAATLPFRMAVGLFMLPIRAAMGILKKDKRTPPERSSKRGSRTSSQTRHGGDRVSSRVSKR